MSKKEPYFRENHALTVIALVTAWISGCGAFGGITLGSGIQNDPTPDGSIVAQGPFDGVNGRTVTGNVSIYRQYLSATGCDFTVRLQSLSAPTDANLYVIPVVNGAPSISPNSYVLRSASGNQNYRFANVSCASTFAQIELSNPLVALPSARSYGIANLNQLTP
jgi:hypothetical protein